MARTTALRKKSPRTSKRSFSSLLFLRGSRSLTATAQSARRQRATLCKYLHILKQFCEPRTAPFHFFLSCVLRDIAVVIDQRVVEARGLVAHRNSFERSVIHDVLHAFTHRLRICVTEKKQHNQHLVPNAANGSQAAAITS